MPRPRRTMTAVALTMAAASIPPLGAQTAEDFDESRALIGETPMFDAFYPEDYESLADVRASGRIGDDTALLTLQHGGTTLALLTNQMAYHHIAQGDLAGEPWMVSF